MQQGHYAVNAVFSSKDITPLLIFELPVNHEGRRAMSKLMCSNKSLCPIIQLRLSHAQWVLYTEGCIIADQYKTYEIDFDTESWDWPGIFRDLDTFSPVEDVVQDIMVNTWTRIPDNIRLDQIREHENFEAIAEIEHLECLGRLMEKYPLNSHIQSIGCAWLLKMYDYKRHFEDLGGIDAAMKHARWALDSASVSDPIPTEELLCTNLRLLIHICEEHRLQSVEEGKSIAQDMISLVFKLQYKWHTSRDLMEFCSELCLYELANWTMPVPLPNSSTPAPVDIITIYMDKYLDDNEYQWWGSSQLKDLAMNNGADIVVSQECMSRIARHIRVQHAEILSKTTNAIYDENHLYAQQENIFTFLNIIVRLSDAAYHHFVAECDVPLLLKSLDNILVMRDVVHNTQQESYQVEISQICHLLMYMCEKDMTHVASFFANEGFEILVHAINYSVCEDSTLKKPWPYSTVCLRLLYGIFCEESLNAMAYITNTQRNGTRTQKRFSFRFRHFGNKLQTFPVYLVQTLCRYESILSSNMDAFTYEDITYIVWLMRIMVLQGDAEEILTLSQIQMIIIAMEQILIKVFKTHLETHGSWYDPAERLEYMESLCDCVLSFDDVIEHSLARKPTRAKRMAVSLFEKYVVISNQFRTQDYDINTFLRKVAP